MAFKKTLVLGASTNPNRYSFLAVNKLKRYGHEVVAVGKKDANIDNIQISKEPILFNDVDTVTLYLNPDNQVQYYDYIVNLHPKRIIFNPGTENDDLVEIAKKNNIETIEACTLVMLSVGQY